MWCGVGGAGGGGWGSARVGGAAAPPERTAHTRMALARRRLDLDFDALCMRASAKARMRCHDCGVQESRLLPRKPLEDWSVTCQEVSFGLRTVLARFWRRAGADFSCLLAASSLGACATSGVHLDLRLGLRSCFFCFCFWCPSSLGRQLGNVHLERRLDCWVRAGAARPRCVPLRWRLWRFAASWPILRSVHSSGMNNANSCVHTVWKVFSQVLQRVE